MTTSQTPLEGFIENCRAAWFETLSRAIGAPCQVQLTHEATALPELPVCVLLHAEGAISGQAALAMDQRSAGMLAGRIPGDSAAKMQGLQDLLRQAMIHAVDEFQKTHGAMRVQVGAGASITWQPQTVLSLIAGNGGAEPMRVFLLLSPQIAASASAPAPQAQHPQLPAADGQRGNMSLVMGVELEVTLRFGQRRLPLKQLLELNAGSVVELDKRVHEPVELLLRDKVFARGEVVIVEGHYGLRITDVCAAPQETL